MAHNCAPAKFKVVHCSKTEWREHDKLSGKKGQTDEKGKILL